MNVEIQSIMDRYHDVASEFLSEWFQKLNHIYLKELLPLQGTIDRYVPQASDPNNSLSIEDWKLFDQELDQLKKWPLSLFECLNAPFIEPWEKTLHSQLYSHYKPNFETSFHSQNWIRSEVDTFQETVWKHQIRFKYNRQQFGLNLTNKIRQWSGKEIKELTAWTRRFNLHLFFQHYLEAPFLEFLNKEQNLYLHQLRSYQRALHLSIQQKFAHILRLTNNDEDNKLETHSLEVQKFKTALEDFENDSQQRFEKWFQQQVPLITRNWSYAGTRILPRQQFNQQLLDSKKAQIQKLGEKHTLLWQQHFSGAERDWQHDWALNHIQFIATQHTLQLLESTQQRFLNQVTPTFTDAIDRLKQSLTRFEDLLSDSSASLRQKILVENHTLRKELRSQVLPSMTDVAVRSQFADIFQRFESRINGLIQGLSEKHVIFKKCDLEQIPPQSSINEIPVKALFEEKITKQLSKSIHSKHQNMQSQLEDVLRNISEIDQIIEFNLATAAKLLKQEQVQEEASQAVTEGIQRGITKIEQCLEAFEKMNEPLEVELNDVALQLNQSIQEMLNNEALLALSVELAKTRAKQTFSESIRFIYRRFKKSIPILWQTLLKTLAFTQRQYLRVQKITGLSGGDENLQQKLFEFITETQLRIQSLPYIYQHLFQIEPLSDERFFIGREKELSFLKHDFLSWKQDIYSMAMVVGERGSGRTSLLNLSEAQVFQGTPLVKIDFLDNAQEQSDLYSKLSTLGTDSLSNLDELSEYLLGLDQPMVCFVENIQNLFLRTIDGLDQVSELLLFASKTQKNVFWVFTSTLYSWDYLNKVLKISRFFQRVIYLSSITRDVMEELILQRHRVTGYQLHFSEPTSIVLRKKWSKLNREEEKQAFLQTTFFNQLDEFAAGNISVAIWFWLRAIEKIENNQIYLSPQTEVENAFLTQLNADELFTLGAIVQHETLSVPEHAKVFMQTEHSSAIVMATLSNKGILLSTETGYKVHPFLYRPLTQVLKRHNILH